MKTKLIIPGLFLAGFFLSCCGPSNEEIIQLERNISEVHADASTHEDYAHAEETGFQSALKNPYSTFSIDVDAASYTNMRGMVLAGQLPPADAVRVEEWINYFNYSYPQPRNDEPFSITTEYSECPWNSDHKLLQIGLKGKEIPQEKAPANHLVFLIDVSGSMSDENKLPLLKRAFALLLPKLKEGDKVSIVTYAGSAGLVLDNISAKNKTAILEALENLGAGGSTAGGEGINLAYAVAKEGFIKDGNNRVIVATDGDFNVGVSSQAELEQLIEEKRNQGIYLSVLGFGTGNIKDNTMELLADKGNGNYNYIDNFEEAKKVLIKQFGGTLHTIAKDVKLQVEFNPEYVKEYRLIGYDNRLLADGDFNDDKKDAGELGSGHCVTALYEIVISSSKEQYVKIDDLKYQESKTATGSNELANIKFRYKHPGKGDTLSKLIEHPVKPDCVPLSAASENYKLASTVTEFGLLMKESAFKGNSSFESAIARAKELKSNDQENYVGELITLMKSSAELKKSAN